MKHLLTRFLLTSSLAYLGGLSAIVAAGMNIDDYDAAVRSPSPAGGPLAPAASTYPVAPSISSRGGSASGFLVPSSLSAVDSDATPPPPSSAVSASAACGSVTYYAGGNIVGDVGGSDLPLGRSRALSSALPSFALASAASFEAVPPSSAALPAYHSSAAPAGTRDVLFDLPSSELAGFPSGFGAVGFYAARASALSALPSTFGGFGGGLPDFSSGAPSLGFGLSAAPSGVAGLEGGSSSLRWPPAPAVGGTNSYAKALDKDDPQGPQ